MQLFYWVTGKVGMGHGDFKLFAALGAWLGWQLLPLVLLLSSVAGAVVGLVYLKLSKQNRDTPIPFGPFLCLAGFVALFWGKDLLNWYLQFIL
jgi:leader peptidase (prepilin peptidase)/N-methyltransferase